MSLANRATQPETTWAGGLPCSIGSLLAKLEPTEAKALHSMLYELNWTAMQVWTALRDEGYTVGAQSINRHRGKRCRCDQGES